MRYRRQLSRYFIIISFLVFFAYEKGWLYNAIKNAPFLGTPLGFIIIFTIVQIILFAIGSYFIQLNYYITSLNRGDSHKKQIALTFDDGPYNNTNKILEVLSKHNVRATFFLIGKNAEKNPDIVKLIDKQDCIIANHSYSHTNKFPLQKSKKIAQDIEKCNQVISEIIGKRPALFRPPFGVTNPMIAKAIEKTGMISVGWSIRSYDTVRNINKATSFIKKKYKNGDVILLHDKTENIEKLTEDLILFFKSKDIQLVTIDEMFGVNAYEKY